MEVIHLPVQQDAPPLTPIQEAAPATLAARAVERFQIAKYLAAVLMATAPKHWPQIIDQFDGEDFKTAAALLMGTHHGNLLFHLAAAYDPESLHPTAALTLLILDWENIAKIAADFISTSTSDDQRKQILDRLCKQELNLLRHEVAYHRSCKFRWLEMIDTRIEFPF